MLKMMHRKAQALKFFIGIVLAIFLFTTTLYGMSKIFRLSDDAMDSFNELIQKINDISGKPAGTIEPIVLHMDKKTAILGFAQNAKKIQYITYYGESSYFERPETCGEDASCICLCRAGYGYAQKTRVVAAVIKDVRAAELPYWLVTCSNLVCKQLSDGVDFPQKINAISLADSEGEITGGFVIERDERLFSYKGEGKGSASRSRPIYLKKKQDVVVLCRSLELCDK